MPATAPVRGGLYDAGGSTELTNVIFAGNYASGDGGGMLAAGGSPTLINITASGDRAEGRGGALRNRLGASAVIYNSIYWNNQEAGGIGTGPASIYSDPGSHPLIDFSLVQGQIPLGDGNLDGRKAENDPLFARPLAAQNAPALGGLLRPLVGSPAINQGENRLLPVALETDLGGDPRIRQGIVDMGAYEIPPPPEIRVLDRDVGEGDGPAVFTVTLSAAYFAPVSVDYSSGDDTALSPGDYAAISGTLTIPAGVARALISISVVDDPLDEADESFTVNLNNPRYGVIVDGTALGVIVDNDPPPRLTIQDVVATEGDGSADFVAALSAVSGLQVSAAYATQRRSATPGSDYMESSGLLVIPAGIVSATVSVPLVDDTVGELTERFVLTVANPINTLLVNDTAQATIVDDDDPPSISFWPILLFGPVSPE